MKKTKENYTSQLRSDYTPAKKNNAGNTRRPFNPGDPNEFLPVPGSHPVTTEENMQFYRSNILNSK